MTELLTAAQMRAIEAAAIASGEVTGLELMERAGRGVVEAIFEEWPELRATSHRAVVLCGPGNNGGDGFVVARLLKEWGWAVEVFLYGDADRMPPDARVNYERWLGMGEVGALAAAAHIRASDRSVRVVVFDALFGTGLRAPLPTEISQPLVDLQWLNDGRTIVSIDVPSGICSDSGRVLRLSSESALDLPNADEVIVPHLTVNLGFWKICSHLGSAPSLFGRTRLVTLGIEKSEAVAELRLRTFDDEVKLCDRAFGVSKSAGAHKYSHGHALILSGHVGKGGAARLAARGALRIGAGLVTVGCPHEALPENAGRLDAVMLTPVHNANELAAVLADARINAVAIGPGLGGKRAQMLVPQVLREKRATVLDADALTAFADDPAKLFAMLHGACVLTPHAGEFARLFPDIAAKLAAPATRGPAYSKVDATREAAKRAGCVVLFKDPDTVIADPTGRCSINSAHYDRAAPWLATAGSGDVLAGFITGLLARGFAPMQAAETAAWLHVECARSFGPGLIAEDLPEELPKVFRALGL